MIDENPYEMPKVDESKWFSGGHLGGSLQAINCQVRDRCACFSTEALPHPVPQQPGVAQCPAELL
jgi:hypothetical protein